MNQVCNWTLIYPEIRESTHRIIKFPTPKIYQFWALLKILVLLASRSFRSFKDPREKYGRIYSRTTSLSFGNVTRPCAIYKRCAYTHWWSNKHIAPLCTHARSWAKRSRARRRWGSHGTFLETFTFIADVEQLALPSLMPRYGNTRQTSARK